MSKAKTFRCRFLRPDGSTCRSLVKRKGARCSHHTRDALKWVARREAELLAKSAADVQRELERVDALRREGDQIQSDVNAMRREACRVARILDVQRLRAEAASGLKLASALIENPGASETDILRGRVLRNAAVRMRVLTGPEFVDTDDKLRELMAEHKEARR